MNPRQFIIVSTMAFVFTIGLTLKGEEADASAPSLLYNKTKEATQTSPGMAVKDDFHRALGVSSDEEVYEALYNGKSLADIAAANHADVQGIINLQIVQMTEQLNQRYASGSLSAAVYEAQRSELAEIITKSVYARSI